MRYLTLDEILELHRMVLFRAGGEAGVRDIVALESAVAQPFKVFRGTELYPTLVTKVSALGFALLQHRPFKAGNARTAHLAMGVMLVLNGYQLVADAFETEQVIHKVMHSEMLRSEFEDWLERHLAEMTLGGSQHRK
jgi:death-on-curing protein